jgi:ribonuclease VapC
VRESAPPESYVLDAWAVLAWQGGEEPAAAAVAELLDRAADGSVQLSMSIVNLGDVYYRVAKAAGLDEADRVRADFESAPVHVESATDEDVWAAAGLKARHVVSYADAFAAALAVRLGAEVVTGDPDFKSLERAGTVGVRWLLRSGASQQE